MDPGTDAPRGVPWLRGDLCLILHSPRDAVAVNDTRRPYVGCLPLKLRWNYGNSALNSA
jgi:hypothetical protein